MWAEQLRHGVRVKRGKHDDEGIPSIGRICKEIGMSARIYRQLVAGDSPNLRNYLRIIFWCIDQYPIGKREQLMMEVSVRLRQEFE